MTKALTRLARDIAGNVGDKASPVYGKLRDMAENLAPKVEVMIVDADKVQRQ